MSWRSRPAWAVLWCLPCPVLDGWSWCFAKLFAWKRMSCPVIVTSNPPGSLYFSRQLVELESQKIWGKGKLNLPYQKGLCSCCHSFGDGASWCQIITCSQLERSCLIPSSRIWNKFPVIGYSALLEYPVWEFFELSKGWRQGQWWTGLLRKWLELIDAYPIFFGFFSPVCSAWQVFCQVQPCRKHQLGL